MKGRSGPAALLLTSLLAACGDGGTARDEAEHECVHDPVYGGKLIEIGEHFAQVELLHDPETGKLTAYLWDGHAEHARPVAMESIRVTVGDLVVKLLPVSDPLTGDQPGASSRFEGTSERLRDLESFEGVLGRMRFGEAEFAETEFRYGK